ncbi:MAG: mechanosensitive ion channel family protein, partial [Cyclobacteriaceae bacterium]
MDADQIQVYTDQFISMVILHTPKILLAVATLVIGFAILKPILNVLRRTMEKQNFDPSLAPFLTNIVGIIFKAMLIISVASMIGVETTSFIAVLGAAGLAIGLALQGSLSNFAAGVLILILKPFKVGDVVDTNGFLGKVHEIQIFNTVIKTFDNRRIILPNSAIS